MMCSVVFFNVTVHALSDETCGIKRLPLGFALVEMDNLLVSELLDISR